MAIIDGKRISAEVCEEVAGAIRQLKSEHDIQPGLAVVIVGDDPASQIYVNSKVKKARQLGIHSFKHELPADTSMDAVIEVIRRLNQDPVVNGILVQSPPPPQIDERTIVETVAPAKDVDCFHPVNVGRLTIGDDDGFLPCTPLGIMTMLRRTGIETAGKHAVVLGRSNIVGKPMALLLSRKGRDATVTICHSKTRNLHAVVRQADILIAAVGRPEFVGGDMVKDDVVVVDVGINRVDDPGAKRGYRLVGDVNFREVSRKASFITPVPGGVGPMTIAILMYNAVKACCLQNRLPAPPLAI